MIDLTKERPFYINDRCPQIQAATFPNCQTQTRGFQRFVVFNNNSTILTIGTEAYVEAPSHFWKTLNLCIHFFLYIRLGDECTCNLITGYLIICQLFNLATRNLAMSWYLVFMKKPLKLIADHTSNFRKPGVKISQVHVV